VIALVIPMLFMANVMWNGFYPAEPGEGKASRVVKYSQNINPLKKNSGLVQQQATHSPNETPAKKSDVAEAARPDPGKRKEEKEQQFAMPDWERIFNPDGSLKDEVNKNGHHRSNNIPDFVDLYNGTMSRFIRDIISNGVATDMSALLGAESLDDQVLYNGPVDPAHDLGNAYFMISTDSEGGPRLFTAVERLSRLEATFIEFEFNQHSVNLGSGAPWWNLKGDRLAGDVLVRMDFMDGSLDSVEIFEWQGNAFEVIQTMPGLSYSGCHNQPSIIYCIGPPRMGELPAEGFEVWDENFVILEATQPDEFVELGIDVGELLRTQVDFHGLVIRTPQDITVNTFKRAERDLSMVVLNNSEKFFQ
jgi:hypothetical protein